MFISTTQHNHFSPYVRLQGIVMSQSKKSTQSHKLKFKIIRQNYLNYAQVLCSTYKRHIEIANISYSYMYVCVCMLLSILQHWYFVLENDLIMSFTLQKQLN